MGMAGKVKLPAEVRAAFAAYGAQGGRKGGKARAAKLTPKQRTEAARKAARARWAKAREGGGQSGSA